MFMSTAVRLGIGIGALASIVCGLVYLVLLREPGSTFCLFGGLAFLGGSLIGGIVAARNTREHRNQACITSGCAVFGIVFILFAFTYVVLPQFARTSVQLPEFCDGYDGSFDPPVPLAYTLPDAGTGMLLASDAQSAVVVTIDSSQPPFPSTLYLINKSDDRIIQRLGFNNDVITATIQDGVLYIYNDKLGYLLDAHTGEFEEDFLLIDNYGGLSESDRPIISRASDGHWYLETTAVISSWKIDGTVRSRPHLTFNGIARGCFISGGTGEVSQL
jgi:hypothetical protein